MKCCIPFCSSERKKGEKQREISYHELPSKEPQRSKWIKIIMTEYEKFGFFCTLGPYTCVCALHFLKDDFRRRNNSYLKPSAYPSVFKYPPLKIQNVRIKNKLNQNESISVISTLPIDSVISTLPIEPPSKVIKLENQNDIYHEQSLTEIGNQDENRHLISEVKYEISSNEEISKGERNLISETITFNSTFNEHTKKVKCKDEENSTEKLPRDEEDSLLIPEITLNSTSNGQNMVKVKIEEENGLLIPEISVDSVAKEQNDMKIENVENEINLSSSSSNFQCLQFICTGSQYN